MIVALIALAATVSAGGCMRRNNARAKPLVAVSILPPYYMLLALTAVVIVIAVKTVGIALASSFVVISTATARMLGRSLPRVALIAVKTGVGGAALGMLPNHYLNVASGATILTLGAGFGLALALRKR
jgi:ABC-type Mn2+/Zn2+ transport system permease subunit